MRLSGSRTTTLISRLSAVALAVAAAGALGTATAHASTGGGCAKSSHVEACISASGANLEPDLYDLNNDGCESVTIEVIDESERNLPVWQDSLVNSGCKLGIHGPWVLNSGNTKDIESGDTYHTDVYMDLAGGSEDVISSPSELLSY